MEKIKIIFTLEYGVGLTGKWHQETYRDDGYMHLSEFTMGVKCIGVQLILKYLKKYDGLMDG